jgi:hypothetical protein
MVMAGREILEISPDDLDFRRYITWGASLAGGMRVIEKLISADFKPEAPCIEEANHREVSC